MHDVDTFNKLEKYFIWVYSKEKIKKKRQFKKSKKTTVTKKG